MPSHLCEVVDVSSRGIESCPNMHGCGEPFTKTTEQSHRLGEPIEHLLSSFSASGPVCKRDIVLTNLTVA